MAEKKSYAKFRQEVEGKRFDVDGAYGAQCWDGYAYYCKWLGNEYNHCSISGGAKDLITLGSPNCTRPPVANRRPGDIAVWRSTSGAGAVYGHVAIYDGNNRYLGQRQGGVDGAFNIIPMGTPDAILRPKNVISTGGGGGEVVNDHIFTFRHGILTEAKKA